MSAPGGLEATLIAELAPAGPESQARLFGVFQVSVLLNTIHLVLGAAGAEQGARRQNPIRPASKTDFSLFCL